MGRDTEERESAERVAPFPPRVMAAVALHGAVATGPGIRPCDGAGRWRDGGSFFCGGHWDADAGAFDPHRPDPRPRKFPSWEAGQGRALWEERSPWSRGQAAARALEGLRPGEAVLCLAKAVAGPDGAPAAGELEASMCAAEALCLLDPPGPEVRAVVALPWFDASGAKGAPAILDEAGELGAPDCRAALKAVTAPWGSTRVEVSVPFASAPEWARSAARRRDWEAEREAEGEGLSAIGLADPGDPARRAAAVTLGRVPAASEPPEPSGVPGWALAMARGCVAPEPGREGPGPAAAARVWRRRLDDLGLAFVPGTTLREQVSWALDNGVDERLELLWRGVDAQDV